jgi:hypothetical protein
MDQGDEGRRENVVERRNRALGRALAWPTGLDLARSARVQSPQPASDRVIEFGSDRRLPTRQSQIVGDSLQSFDFSPERSGGEILHKGHLSARSRSFYRAPTG